MGKEPVNRDVLDRHYRLEQEVRNLKIKAANAVDDAGGGGGTGAVWGRAGTVGGTYYAYGELEFTGIDNWNGEAWAVDADKFTLRPNIPAGSGWMKYAMGLHLQLILDAKTFARNLIITQGPTTSSQNDILTTHLIPPNTARRWFHFPVVKSLGVPDQSQASPTVVMRFIVRNAETDVTVAAADGVEGKPATDLWLTRMGPY